MFETTNLILSTSACFFSVPSICQAPHFVRGIQFEGLLKILRRIA
jgi:hypothetical protein